MDGISEIQIRIPEVLSEHKDSLMMYPMNIIIKEFNAIKFGQYKENMPGNYSYSTRGDYYPVNCKACSCYINNSMSYHQRWTKNYIHLNHRILVLEPQQLNSNLSMKISEQRKRNPKSRNEKFTRASVLTTELANVMFKSSV